MPDYSERLTALRREISKAGLDGFVAPRTDDYQSEYIPLCAERIAFLCGFTGSAAIVVVLKDKASFFTDGRYTLQASQQISKQDYAIFDSAEKTSLVWIEENVPPGAKIGYDPWLHSADWVDRLKNILMRIGAKAIPVATNLIDIIWKDRPSPPATPIVPYDIAYAGKPAAAKREEIAENLKKTNVAAAVLSDPTSIAWLLNVRANDVANTPAPLSRAIIANDGTVNWFIDFSRTTNVPPEHLGKGVRILPPSDFLESLRKLGAAQKPVLCDPSHTPSQIVDTLRATQAKIEDKEDPCALPRAIKNPTELNGMRLAHELDGTALINFLAWLNARWGEERVTELAAVRKLETFRTTVPSYRGPSFETISASGDHGAIVHYRATETSNAPLAANKLYLIDTGGQYLEGTTDVTRTIALGLPPQGACEDFTRVLKGHIGLSSIVFPEGTTGADLDVLARQYLWAAGKDYSHGTGHGVGCYLSVHEGPHGISKRNKVPLKPGMVLSNEPGYYKEGHYGVRIESLMEVVEIADPPAERKKTFGFRTLTLVPLDKRLIDISLLTDAEISWINTYHGRVKETLRSKVNATALPWLDAITEKLER